MTSTAAREVVLDLDDSWSIGGKIHGGYLLSEISRAALALLPGDSLDPLAVSAHFLSAPDPGAAMLSVEVLRSGRTVTALRARLVQQESLRTEVLLTAGTLPIRGEPVWVAPAGMPDLPPPEECERSPAVRPDGVRIGHLDHVDLRLDPATSGWARGEPARSGELHAWIQPERGTRNDPLWLIVATDALPPITFNFGMLGWVPTVAFDVQLRGTPTSAWVKAVQHAQLISDGWLDETCDVYDEAGRLVASARQLAAYRG